MWCLGTSWRVRVGGGEGGVLRVFWGGKCMCCAGAVLRVVCVQSLGVFVAWVWVWVEEGVGEVEIPV